jgi:DNA (cytosine-5)-methyltransferase 1
MRFGSVCSGIEAASVAWHPLGWEAAWLSEIEPFPCAVLKHHYPDVPNHGDMTLLPEKILSGEVEAPDLFCGGTPCQAFSVAGLRNSLDDARGNLSLTFVGIANAIDHVRSVRRDAPAVIFWENVPGVLNTKDNAFGCFLGALAGETEQIIPPGDKWTNSGCVFGPQRTVAWRVLDAQYFGVAQRRRRVFVVASARDDFDPAAVLFEFEGVRRDIAPSRESRESSTANFRSGVAEICPTIGCELAKQVNNQMVGNAEAFYIPEPIGFENSRRDGVRLYDDVSNTLQAFAGTGGGNGPMVSQPIPLNSMNCFRSPDADPSTGCGIGEAGEAMFTITKTNSHAVAAPIAFPSTMSGTQHASAEDVAPSMGAKNATAVAYSFDSLSSNSMKSSNPHSGCRETDLAKTIDTFDPNPSKNQGGIAVMQSVAYNIAPGKGELKDDIHVTDAHVSKTIDASGSNPAMHQGGAAIVQKAYSIREDAKANTFSATPLEVSTCVGSLVPSVQSHHAQTFVANHMAVRRLTPMECERLQGFPDGYSNIPWRGKAESPDGPRYKALGNSWAVPVVRWIGKRIQERITT